MPNVYELAQQKNILPGLFFTIKNISTVALKSFSSKQCCSKYNRNQGPNKNRVPIISAYKLHKLKYSLFSIFHICYQDELVTCLPN